MLENTASTKKSEGSPHISAVILDYGQVLVRCPTLPEFARMAEILHVGVEKICQLWDASRDPYDRGDITGEQYWLNLAAQTNATLAPGQIGTLRQLEVEIWTHTDPDMLDWLSQLHAAGLKTGLLSNMPLDLVAHLRANFGWMENFTFKTFSAEVRLIKPDPAIYQHTLRGLGASAPEALFVDDREPNIRAARALGIRAIQFRSVAQLKADLEALGFPILPRGAEKSSVVAEPPRNEIKLQL